MDNFDRAVNLLSTVMEPLRLQAQGLDSLGLWAVPSADHLVAARHQAALQLQRLNAADQQATYGAALDILINQDQRVTRYTRQVLCNTGEPRSLDALEPKQTSPAAQLLQRLNADHGAAAAAAYELWRASRTQPPNAPTSPKDAYQLQTAAERACRRAFGLDDARTLELLLANLATCVATQDGPAAADTLSHLANSSCQLSCAQAEQILATEPLARRMIGCAEGPQEREVEAKAWLHLYAWAMHNLQPADAAQQGPCKAALARLSQQVQCLASDPLAADTQRVQTLQDQVEQMLEKLQGQGRGAEQLRRRARAKMVEWKQASQDNQRAAEMWLEKWLTLTTGYPLAEIPTPLPAYDRPDVPATFLGAQEVDRRLALFAETFNRGVVGNTRLFCELRHYLRTALLKNEPILVLLHGEAGTGKSGIAEILAETVFANAHFHTKNLGGTSLASSILGVSPTYHGSEFSLFAEGLAQRRGQRVFFFVDEVDHAEAAVQDALATALDFNPQVPFQDGYLQVPVPLQNDPIVIACNEASKLQKQLISRFRKGLVAKAEVLDEPQRQEVIWRQHLSTLARYGRVPYSGGASIGHLPFAATQGLFAPSFFARLETYHQVEPGLRALLSVVQKVTHMGQLTPHPAAWSYPLKERHVALACFENWLTVNWQQPVDKQGHTWQLFDFELGLFNNDVSRRHPSFVFCFADGPEPSRNHHFEIQQAQLVFRTDAGLSAGTDQLYLHSLALEAPYPQKWPANFAPVSAARPAVFHSDRSDFFATQEICAPVELLPSQRFLLLRGQGLRVTSQ